MKPLACGHEGLPAPWRTCPHVLAALTDDELDLEWVRLLPELGLEGDVSCPECAGMPAERRPLVPCCERCMAWIEDNGDGFVGFHGTPGVRERPQPFPSETEAVALPAGLQDPLDVQPLEAGSGSAWVFLTRGGDLVRFELEGSVLRPLASVPEAVAPEPVPESEVLDHRREWQVTTREPRALHLSPDGRYGAIVAVHGPTGSVVDLERGVATMGLERDDYKLWACRFPCAFLERDGRALLVHGTGWNRLDVSDPATGELLTGRGPTGYRAGEERPLRHLEYFHGALAVSPSGGSIADDGWIWHPVGIVRAWSADTWLGENVWESEDGPSIRRVCSREGYWGKPICWLDDTTLAVTGIGDDAHYIIPGVRVLDVPSATERLAFAGPEGELFYDGYLFSANPDGLQVWDPRTGERLARLEGFRPSRHHRAARELIELRRDHVVRWRIPE